MKKTWSIILKVIIAVAGAIAGAYHTAERKRYFPSN